MRDRERREREERERAEKQRKKGPPPGEGGGLEAVGVMVDEPSGYRQHQSSTAGSRTQVIGLQARRERRRLALADVFTTLQADRRITPEATRLRERTGYSSWRQFGRTALPYEVWTVGDRHRLFLNQVGKPIWEVLPDGTVQRPSPKREFVAQQVEFVFDSKQPPWKFAWSLQRCLETMEREGIINFIVLEAGND